MNGSNKKRIVVLGGGFGGLEFCKTFRHEHAEIILVDRQKAELEAELEAERKVQRVACCPGNPV